MDVQMLLVHSLFSQDLNNTVVQQPHSETCSNSYLVRLFANFSSSKPFVYFQACWTFFWLWAVSSSLFLILFLIFKNKFDRSRIRPAVMPIYAWVGLVCSLCATHLADYLGDMPCWIYGMLIIVTAPLLGGALLGRLALFYYFSIYSEIISNDAKINMTNFGYITGDIAEIHKKLPFYQRFRIGFQSLFCFQRVIKNGMDEHVILALKFMQGFWGTTVFISILFLPFLIAAIVIVVSSEEILYCSGCYASLEMEIIIIACGVSYLILGTFFWHRGRRFHDPWGLRNESFYVLVFLILALVCFILSSLVEFPGQGFDFVFFQTLFLNFAVFHQTSWQLVLAERSSRKLQGKFEKKIARIDSLTSKTVDLDEILKDQELSKEFQIHLQNELGLESLFFLKDVESWKASFFDIHTSARRSRAVKIVNSFIQPDGIFVINVPASVSTTILKIVLEGKEDEEEDVPLNVFDEAVGEVKTLLNSGAVMRFALKADASRTMTDVPALI